MTVGIETISKLNKRISALQGIINAQKAEIGALKANSNKHGTWNQVKHQHDMAIYGKCSECKYEYNKSQFNAITGINILRGHNYCPNCGTKMEEN